MSLGINVTAHCSDCHFTIIFIRKVAELSCRDCFVCNTYETVIVIVISILMRLFLIMFTRPTDHQPIQQRNISIITNKQSYANVTTNINVSSQID
jgi:hypothetical protein